MSLVQSPMVLMWTRQRGKLDLIALTWKWSNNDVYIWEYLGNLKDYVLFVWLLFSSSNGTSELPAIEGIMLLETEIVLHKKMQISNSIWSPYRVVIYCIGWNCLDAVCKMPRYLFLHSCHWAFPARILKNYLKHKPGDLRGIGINNQLFRNLYMP